MSDSEGNNGPALPIEQFKSNKYCFTRFRLQPPVEDKCVWRISSNCMNCREKYHTSDPGTTGFRWLQPGVFAELLSSAAAPVNEWNDRSGPQTLGCADADWANHSLYIKKPQCRHMAAGNLESVLREQCVLEEEGLTYDIRACASLPNSNCLSTGVVTDDSLNFPCTHIYQCLACRLAKAFWQIFSFRDNRWCCRCKATGHQICVAWQWNNVRLHK